MSLSINKTAETVEFRNDSSGKFCGIYHYMDPYKSYFRGLYTPSGNDVVGYAADHPHHKGLQFGLTTDKANFWEESEASEPDKHKLPIGEQRTTRLDLLPSTDGIGFTQRIDWLTEGVCVFNEARQISVVETSGAYIWTWETTLITTLASGVQIIKSVWDAPAYCYPQYGYCGIGLRLTSDLFKDGEVLPAGTQCGEPPASVSFRGKGAEVRFEQNTSQGDALFVTTYQNVGPYPGGPGFAFLGLVPTPRAIAQDQGMELMYTITVSDV